MQHHVTTSLAIGVGRALPAAWVGYSRTPVELTTSLGRVALGGLGGASPTAAQAPPRDRAFWAPRTRGPRRADSARWGGAGGETQRQDPTSVNSTGLRGLRE
jgi:hypothetical protein